MSMTLEQMVREHLTSHPSYADTTVDGILNNMTHAEFLKLISDQLRRAAANMAVRPWV